ncbi:hypothetical protein CC85DRAFT_304923 [Cutaneotrichosporon oleaginosum]|uniref:Uncharacterized protein n=1 Tax=Cutaneotrichosporon oleaginosum TaxID=879819 RepID=A0A0J0XEQ4_9TREE|nr:uncharacterized protein CC85DRAFT_304923 [Cutaneotrichosporon oleaginosum]KLT39552.1 hypothetical protein CC85DRAFT_304923 [Cutaneotrichosporon oleaginosum]
MVKRERSESVTPPRSPSPEPAPPKKSRAINTAKGLGVSKQSVGDQLVKNRNNLRKLAIDLVRAKKGGGGA